MNDRIKSLRKQLGLTQEEFAARIRVKRGAIANYEIGRNEPVDSVLSLICREFRVNEQWLRTGEGEMFLPKSRNEELLAFVEQLAGSDSNDIRVQIATIMARLSSEDWEAVNRIANEFLKLNAQAEEC
ncbi:MAG TPA: XRE family transcriptional regulator [Clostridiales bacterium]|nr:XRE family transcriptional regulator [Clostridiales bacterium]